MPTDEPCLFIIADKARARPRGDTEKGCRCGERLRAKAGGRRSLAHTRWLLVRAGEGVPNREREVNRRREVCECQEASE
jgi:hypothetical protein